MDAASPASWTVLIYTSASRDLEKFVRDSLQEISHSPGPPQDVRVVAQMGWQGQAQRFQLHQTDLPLALTPPRPTDMTEPQQLRDFVSWGMRTYPARHFAVVLGGHGAGFAGAVTDSERRHMLKLPELEHALSELPQWPDLVVFNTCLMAQAEVAEQLAPVTNFLVASQSQLSGLGLPLAAWIQHLPQCHQGGAAAGALVHESAQVPERAPHVGAVDLDQWPQVSARLDELAVQILAHPEARPVLVEQIRQQPHLWPREQDRPLVDQLDVVGLCRAWQEQESLPDSLRQRAAEVAEALHKVSEGLSIYAPDRPFGWVDKTYGELRWSEKTHWDEAIRWLVSAETSVPGTEVESKKPVSP